MNAQAEIDPATAAAVRAFIADLADDVLLECGIRIQPYPIWEEESAHPERYPNPPLLHRIAMEGTPL